MSDFIYRGGPHAPAPGQTFMFRGQSYTAIACDKSIDICKECAFNKLRTCNGIGIPACGPVIFNKTVDAIADKLTGVLPK